MSPERKTSGKLGDDDGGGGGGGISAVRGWERTERRKALVSPRQI